MSRSAGWLCAVCAVMATAPLSANEPKPIPPYEHILVIILENQDYKDIMDDLSAQNIRALADAHGLATNFYGEVHPSEANYVAILGGDTFGIHDDDAWYCRIGNLDRNCSSADSRDPYVDHTISARSLMDQLTERGLTWKGYFQGLPEPGSTMVWYPDLEHPVEGKPLQLYGSKHNGFLNFKSVQKDPQLGAKIVGFDQLGRDLESGRVPNYAHIIPDLCNDMHGLDIHTPNVPKDCDYNNKTGRIRRGDQMVGELVAKIKKSPIWSAAGNAAIVITWDEAATTSDESGCCGSDPASLSNFGGGHIPTIVVTNHGVGQIKDPTPYNHYSLLRTTEEAFGIQEHLGHANDTDKGVRSMAPLFQLPGSP